MTANINSLISVMAVAQAGEPCFEPNRALANLIAIRESAALLNPEWFNAQFDVSLPLADCIIVKLP